jgi:hypothetical protein
MAAFYNTTISTSSCPAVVEAAKSAGCCTTVCNLCGLKAYVPYDPFPSTTCEDLSLGADYNYTISEDDCAAAIQLAETEGCCVARPTYDCNLCGDATFYPDNAVVKVGTCGFLQSILNETYCAQLNADLACCSPPSGGLTDPTPAPQESTTSEPGAPPSAAPDGGPSAPSKSAATWSTSTLVSLVGLVTAATTSGALMLN